MLARLWSRQNPHSLYLGAASVIFAVTLIYDIVTGNKPASLMLSWFLLITTLTLGATAVYLGTRFPVSVGLFCVALFTVASLIFLSPLGDEQSAVSSAQELPIAALYLGWFVKRPYGLWIMATMMVLVAIMIFNDPLFHPNGTLGVPTALQIIIVSLFCFIVGSVLWRHSERLLSTDSLTGAMTRKVFRERVDQEIGRQRIASQHSSLILIDFNDFKILNDQHGHAQGDQALSESVADWKGHLRETDSIGRIGGDEFAILLVGADQRQAAETARRLQQTATHPWSWGAAQIAQGDSIDSLFSRADAELYRAKAVKR